MLSKARIAPLSLAALAVALYAQTIGGEFLRWDDRQNILLNPFIANALWLQTWTRPYYNMFIPVTYSVWTALWHITTEPWIFHALNVVLHAGNVALVYLMARCVFKKSNAAPWWAAVLFAVHPLQVETVAWISTGRDLLSAFFGLCAAYIIISRESRRWWAFATLLFVLGLASKPSVSVLPAALLGLAWTTQKLSRARAVTLGLWFIPAGAAIVATKMIQQLDADLRVSPLGLFDRLAVAGDALGFYVRQTVWPAWLGSDYGRSPEVVLSEWHWGPNVLILLATVGLVMVFRRKIKSPQWTGLWWAIVFWAPVLGLIAFQAQGQSTVADRYCYLPLVGVSFTLANVLAQRRRVAVLICVSLSALTLHRSRVWRRNADFFADMLATNPKSFVAYSSLGVEYILQNKLTLAETHLNEAVRMKPFDAVPRANLAQLFLLLNRPDRVTAEVAPLFKDAEFLRQNQTETRALASALRLTARAFWIRGDYFKALEHFCRWYQLDWENEDGLNELKRFIADAERRKIGTFTCELSSAK